MTPHEDWLGVYQLWFPPSVQSPDVQTHWRLLEWWMRGGINNELSAFAPLVEAARSQKLEHWTATPKGRLALILLLDQFPRGLFPGTPDAFASDDHARRIAEDGLATGHYEALAHPWEKFFFVLPLAHAEGPGHLGRMERVVALAETLAAAAPPNLTSVYEFSLSQARGHLEVISRFGRFPHRNAILGRVSTPDELVYLEEGDLVHTRQLPRQTRSIS